MNYDSFEENIQIEEIIPEEYEDWLESFRNEEHDEWFWQLCEYYTQEYHEEGVYAEA